MAMTAKTAWPGPLLIGAPAYDSWMTNGVLVCKIPLNIGEEVVGTFGASDDQHLLLHVDPVEVARLRKLHEELEK